MSDVKLEAINQITPVAKRLEGQTIILTGGGNGIGRNAVERFAAEGANVVVNDINPAVADAVAAELCDRYGDGCAMGFGGDVTADGFNSSMVEATVERYGELDSIVCNAGVTRDSRGHAVSGTGDADRPGHVGVQSRRGGPFAACNGQEEAGRDGEGAGAVHFWCVGARSAAQNLRRDLRRHGEVFRLRL